MTFLEFSSGAAATGGWPLPPEGAERGIQVGHEGTGEQDGHGGDRDDGGQSRRAPRQQTQQAQGQRDELRPGTGVEHDRHEERQCQQDRHTAESRRHAMPQCDGYERDDAQIRSELVQVADRRDWDTACNGLTGETRNQAEVLGDAIANDDGCRGEYCRQDRAH